MTFEIDIEAWPNGDWDALAQAALAAVSQVEPALANQRLENSLLFTSDAQVHALNKQWRDKDKPTNVLSFPMIAREDLLTMDSDGPPAMLGDLAIAYETCAREATEKGVSLEDHTAHLIIHGLLHLAGHDHETSPNDADVMEALEITALASMGIANPYSDNDSR